LEADDGMVIIAMDRTETSRIEGFLERVFLLESREEFFTFALES
jgi:hypothetical protein